MDTLEEAPVQESPETIQEQLDMVQRKQRRAMLLTQAGQAPVIPDGLRRFPVKQGTFVYDPSSISPAELAKASQEDKIGDVLGYGVSRKPVDPSTVVTVRNAQGVEKQAVAIDNASLQSVFDAAKNIQGPSDTIQAETPQQTIKKRSMSPVMLKLFDVAPDGSLVSKPSNGLTVKPSWQDSVIAFDPNKDYEVEKIKLENSLADFHAQQMGKNGVEEKNKLATISGYAEEKAKQYAGLPASERFHAGLKASFGRLIQGVGETINEISGNESDSSLLEYVNQKNQLQAQGVAGWAGGMTGDIAQFALAGAAPVIGVPLIFASGYGNRLKDIRDFEDNKGVEIDPWKKQLLALGSGTIDSVLLLSGPGKVVGKTLGSLESKAVMEIGETLVEKGAKEAFKVAGKELGVDVVKNAALMTGAQGLQNSLEHWGYNEDKPLTEGLLQAGLTGAGFGLVGGLVTGVKGLVGGKELGNGLSEKLISKGLVTKDQASLVENNPSQLMEIAKATRRGDLVSLDTYEDISGKQHVVVKTEPDVVPWEMKRAFGGDPVAIDQIRTRIKNGEDVSHLFTSGRVVGPVGLEEFDSVNKKLDDLASKIKPEDKELSKDGVPLTRRALLQGDVRFIKQALADGWNTPDGRRVIEIAKGLIDTANKNKVFESTKGFPPTSEINGPRRSVLTPLDQTPAKLEFIAKRAAGFMKPSVELTDHVRNRKILDRLKSKLITELSVVNGKSVFSGPEAWALSRKLEETFMDKTRQVLDKSENNSKGTRKQVVKEIVQTMPLEEQPGLIDFMDKAITGINQFNSTMTQKETLARLIEDLTGYQGERVRYRVGTGNTPPHVIEMLQGLYKKMESGGPEYKPWSERARDVLAQTNELSREVLGLVKVGVEYREKISKAIQGLPDTAKVALLEMANKAQTKVDFQAVLDSVKSKTEEIVKASDSNKLKELSKRLETSPRRQEGLELLRSVGDFVGGKISRAASIIGWHGSPHDFDKFSSEKIGTGEGAQAFGYGHYFASKQEVAKYYRDKLTERTAWRYTGVNDPKDSGKFYAVAHVMSALRDGKTFTEAIDTVKTNMEEVGPKRNSVASAVKLAEKILVELLKLKESEFVVGDRGKLYQVELAPNEDELLDWDRPFSQQSPKVQEALQKLGFKEENTTLAKGGNRESTGKDLYHRWDDPTLASEELHKAGIRGIRYLEGASRNRSYGVTYRGLSIDALMGTVDNPYVEMAVKFVGKKLQSGMSFDAAKAEAKISKSLGENARFSAEGLEAKDFQITPSKDASHNYVIFDDKDISIKSKQTPEALGMSGLMKDLGLQQPKTPPKLTASEESRLALAQDNKAFNALSPQHEKLNTYWNHGVRMGFFSDGEALLLRYIFTDMSPKAAEKLTHLNYRNEIPSREGGNAAGLHTRWGHRGDELSAIDISRPEGNQSRLQPFIHEYLHNGYYVFLDESQVNAVEIAHAKLLAQPGEKANETKAHDIIREISRGLSDEHVDYYARDPGEFFAEAGSRYLQEKKTSVPVLKKIWDGLRDRLTRYLVPFIADKRASRLLGQEFKDAVHNIISGERAGEGESRLQREIREGLLDEPIEEFTLDKTPGGPEKLTDVAIKLSDGKVIAGGKIQIHAVLVSEAFLEAHPEISPKDFFGDMKFKNEEFKKFQKGLEEGFLTSTGRYVDRVEGRKIGEAAGQARGFKNYALEAKPLKPPVYRDATDGKEKIDYPALTKALDKLTLDQVQDLKNRMAQIIRHGDIEKGLYNKYLKFIKEEDALLATGSLKGVERSALVQKADKVLHFGKVLVDPVSNEGWLFQQARGDSNNALYQIFHENLVEGMSRHEMNSANARKFVDGAMSLLGIKGRGVSGQTRLSKHLNEKLDNGIRRRDAMWAYALSTDPGRTADLAEFGIKTKNKVYTAKDAIAQLDSKDKAFVDKVKSYLKDNPFMENGFSKFTILNGIDSTKYPNYFTSRRVYNPEELSSDFNSWTNSVEKKINPLKDRVDQSKGPFDVTGGFLDAFYDLTDSLSKYGELSIPMLRAERLLNNPEFRQKFIDQHGEAKLEGLEVHLKHVMGKLGNRPQVWDHAVNWINSSWTVSKIALRPFSAMKQLGHMLLIYADNNLSSKALTRALVEGSGFNPEVGKRMREGSGLAYNRYEGGDFISALTLLSEEKGTPSRLKELQHKSMFLQRAADAWVMKNAWRAAEIMADEAGLKGQAKSDYVRRKFEVTAGRDQPTSNPLYAGELEEYAIRNPIARGALAFMREQNRIYNVQRRHIVNAIQNPTEANIKQAGNAILFGSVAMSAFITGVNNLRRMAYNKVAFQAEDTRDDVIENLAGSWYLIGDAVVPAVIAMFDQTKRYREGDTGKGPVGSILMDGIKFMNSTHDVIATLDDEGKDALVSQGKNRGETKTAHYTKTLLDSGSSFLGGVSGLPIWGIWEQMSGLYNWTRPDLKMMTELEIEKARAMKQPQANASTLLQIKHMKEHINKIHQRREKGYLSQEDAQDQITNILRQRYGD